MFTSPWGYSHHSEQDFHIVMNIVDSLIYHTARMYSVMKAMVNTNLNSAAIVRKASTLEGGKSTASGNTPGGEAQPK